MLGHKALKIDEIMDILNSSENDCEIVTDVRKSEKVNVIYIPADVDEVSDNEAIDDDVIEDNAPLSVDIAGTMELEYAVAEVELHALPDQQQNAKAPSKKFISLAHYSPAVWRKRPFAYNNQPENVEAKTVEKVVRTLGGKSPLELFEFFFDENMSNMIINFSNEYALQNNACLDLKQFELKRFIGILFLSGYHSLPQWKLYWSLSPGMEVQIVRNALPRSRFEAIKRFIHLSDNTMLNKQDKFAKVRPFIDASNYRFMQFGIWSHDLSIDEQMLPYFGRHSCKMFICGKPIRFGFKAWCLCLSAGYLYQIILYGGAATPHDKTVGLGGDIVLKLLENVTSPLTHRIFLITISLHFILCVF
ncbi:piggyBac transposable element-derived protein 2-like [Teleopsis dalmanni]|uniref:piggyBac transposable element-derived protein 2-like n=1 Tax=Teleopsis dalmanni TaxID=139649 RepID=UPI0018CEA066|nr:piggyBac transposable element-derived protein 2-like [Teleopsis dalmanni]